AAMEQAEYREPAARRTATVAVFAAVAAVSPHRADVVVVAVLFDDELHVVRAASMPGARAGHDRLGARRAANRDAARAVADVNHGAGRELRRPAEGVRLMTGMRTRR